MVAYPMTTLVTTSLIVVAVWLGTKVSKARKNFAVEKQDSTMYHSREIYDQPEFFAAFRNHSNFLEQLLIFLPALWLFAFSYSDQSAALIGVGFFLGRLAYAKNYPTAHRNGFLLSAFSLLILFVGVMGRAVHRILT